MTTCQYERMLYAYIDESGDRGLGPNASDHFVMTAVVIRDTNLVHLNPLLEKIRRDVGRPSGAYLSWKNVRSHPQRLHIAHELAAATWVKTVTVIVCKRHLPSTAMNASQTYMYTFRLLLERLSWLARSERDVVTYTLAHIRGFKVTELRHYEAVLKTVADCRVAWTHVDPAGGAIDQPQRMQELQLADLFASIGGAAFNVDDFGHTEPRYLTTTSPLIYRHGNSAITSYGLKVHPWNTNTEAAYPWVAAL